MWIMDKLGYMPKINVQVNKIVDFPVETKPAKKPTRKTVARKATKVAKKAT